jgi:hypothetical protein
MQFTERLRNELEHRLANKGYVNVEWAQLLRDLDRVEQVEINLRFLVPRPTRDLASLLFGEVSSWHCRRWAIAPPICSSLLGSEEALAGTYCE